MTPTRLVRLMSSVAAAAAMVIAINKDGFDAADRGDYVSLRSDREIDDFVDQVRREASWKLVANKMRA